MGENREGQAVDDTKVSLEKVHPISWAQEIINCDLCYKPTKQFCNNCQVSLCVGCVSKHVDKYQSLTHDIVPFKNRKIQLVFSECEFHPHLRCEAQCLQCDVPVCIKCILGNHKGHDAEELSNIVANRKEEIQKETKEIETIFIPRHKKNEDDVKSKASKCTARYDELEQKTEKHRQIWHNEVDTIFNTLGSVIKFKKSINLAKLETQRTKIKSLILEMKETVEQNKEILKTNRVFQVSNYRSKLKEYKNTTTDIDIKNPSLITNTGRELSVELGEYKAMLTQTSLSSLTDEAYLLINSNKTPPADPIKEISTTKDAEDEGMVENNEAAENDQTFCEENTCVNNNDTITEGANENITSDKDDQSEGMTRNVEGTTVDQSCSKDSACNNKIQNADSIKDDLATKDGKGKGMASSGVAKSSAEENNKTAPTDPSKEIATTRDAEDESMAENFEVIENDQTSYEGRSCLGNNETLPTDSSKDISTTKDGEIEGLTSNDASKSSTDEGSSVDIGMKTTGQFVHYVVEQTSSRLLKNGEMQIFNRSKDENVLQYKEVQNRTIHSVLQDQIKGNPNLHKRPLNSIEVKFRFLEEQSDDVPFLPRNKPNRAAGGIAPGKYTNYNQDSYSARKGEDRTPLPHVYETKGKTPCTFAVYHTNEKKSLIKRFENFMKMNMVTVKEVSLRGMDINSIKVFVTITTLSRGQNDGNSCKKFIDDLRLKQGSFMVIQIQKKESNFDDEIVDIIPGLENAISGKILYSENHKNFPDCAVNKTTWFKIQRFLDIDKHDPCNLS